MPTPLTGWCPHCGAAIQTPNANRADVIQCPNCGREVEVGAVLGDGNASNHTARVAWWTGLGVVVVVILVAAYVYRGHVLSALDIIADETGGRTTAVLTVVGGLLLIFWLLVWFLFPLVVYLGLRDLRRRNAELERTSRLCLRQLAQLTADRGIRQGPPTGQPNPGPPLPAENATPSE